VERRLMTTDRAALNHRALLYALHPDRDAFAQLVRAQVEQIDWTEVLDCADGHKVSALVAARIEECGAGAALGTELRARVAQTRQMATQRAAAAERSLAYLVDQFGRAGIPFFAVKGSLLSHHVYGEPSLRRFNDVDIVVRRCDVERAERLLREQSFRPGGLTELLGKPQPKRGPGRDYAHRLARHFDAKRLAAFSWYEPAKSGLTPVDLHWHIAPYRLRVPEDDVWQQTAPAVVAGTRILALNAPAALIHLALHATTCLLNGFRLLHLCDVGWAARRMAGQEDAVWRLAQQWNVEQHLALVFATVERALGVQTTMARSNGSGRARLRPWQRRATSAQFLIESTENARRPLATRISDELAWSLTMRCLRRNVVVGAAASSARLRLRFFRWVRNC
jgi:hypothetical protein